MAGSGKTTLARQLAARLNAPCYELDVIGYENGSGAKRPLEQRQADIQKIIEQPSWIVEGAFLWWIDDLLTHADVIVWLDLHWRLCWWRIVLRHIKADLSPQQSASRLSQYASVCSRSAALLYQSCSCCAFCA